MPCRNELVAFGKNEREIATIINADEVIFQDLNDLVECVKGDNLEIDGFEMSVFTGSYVTG